MQEFEETDGFLDFESRRRSKVDKQMSGGATQNLEEGVDRKLAGSWHAEEAFDKKWTERWQTADMRLWPTLVEILWEGVFSSPVAPTHMQNLSKSEWHDTVLQKLCCDYMSHQGLTEGMNTLKWWGV